MHPTNARFGVHALILAVLSSAALLTLPSCDTDPTQPRTPIDLAAFRTMARESDCAEVRNRLFLIDARLVLWDRAGNCVDAGYAQILYGRTVDDVLCSYRETIAGPMKGCPDERYGSLFETMIANLDQPDLGLGPRHDVRAIPF